MNDCTCPSRGESPHSMDCASTLRDALRIHHPIMRNETGLFSGCRCGQVRLGQDVIAHVVTELRRALGTQAGEELPWCNASFCREHENGEHRITTGRCIIVPASQAGDGAADEVLPIDPMTAPTCSPPAGPDNGRGRA